MNLNFNKAKINSNILVVQATVQASGRQYTHQVSGQASVELSKRLFN